MLCLRDIMTTDLIVISPEASVREAMELLTQRGIAGAPVVSGGRLVGVVTGTDLMTFAAGLSGVPTKRDTNSEFDADEEPCFNGVEREDEAGAAYFTELWDDAGAAVTERMAETGNPEWNALEAHEVSELMTRPPLHVLPPTASVQAAAELMARTRIHRVLVTEGEALVGIVSALDVVGAAAAGQLTRHTFVFR